MRSAKQIVGEARRLLIDAEQKKQFPPGDVPPRHEDRRDHPAMKVRWTRAGRSRPDLLVRILALGLGLLRLAR
jgi:hypothetical protein